MTHSFKGAVRGEGACFGFDPYGEVAFEHFK